MRFLAVAALAFAGVSRTPVQLYTSSLAAARAQHSVHYVAGSVFGGGRAVTIVGDAARDRGIQRITVRQGAQTGHVTVIVVANVAYERGDAFTLRSYLGFSAADTARYAGRWVSIKSSQPRFKPTAAAVRLQSTIDELEMPPPFTAVPAATVAGQRVTGVRARFTRSGVDVIELLYVRASGQPLPVKQVAAATNGIGVTTTFSRWNEAVHVAAPAGATPLR